jgi:hypothetical protein
MSMALQQPFSKRNRFTKPKDITIREDAPQVCVEPGRRLPDDSQTREDGRHQD